MREQISDRKEYLEKLWACYQEGISEHNLDSKQLFIALIDDLLSDTIKQCVESSPLTVERVLDAIEKKYGELAVLHIYPSGINTVWRNGKLLKSIDGNIKRWVQQVESEGK